MKKIAVIGGSGFLGSYILNELRSRNFDVLNFDIRKSLSTVDYDYIDVADLSTKKLKTYLLDIDVIIDLVYATNPKTSFDDPVSDVLKNLPNAVNLFSIASELPKLKNFIYISSGGTVYGNSDKIKIGETHKTNPISPYGITKLAIEKYGLMYHRIKNLPFTIARPANAYGIGQKPNTGQGFIIAAIDSILNGRNLTIYGNTGTIRDYIYVSDIAKAIADLSELDGAGEIYNIGTGRGASNLQILEILKPLASQINEEVNIKFEQSRKFDVLSNILDTRKIYDICGWENKIELEQGIKLTWDNALNTLHNFE